MDSSNFRYLLEGYLWDTLSSEELVAFLQLARQPESQEQLEARMHELLTKGSLRGLADKTKADRIFYKIIERIAQPERRSKVVSWRKWAAAAAIAIVLGTASYLYLVNSNKNSELTTTGPGKLTPKDIAPGGDRAVLTLANGQKIILDSAANGTLALQGNARVVKMANGQLVYTIEGSEGMAPVYNTMSTPRGGQYKLTLPDGTNVWLNAASSITYPASFAGKERRVTVTGEVYFEVAKDKTKPFHVAANGMDVEVLGTHFNINSYEDEGVDKTTLLEGAVRITKGTSSVQLKPGEQAVLSQSQGSRNTIEVVRNVNIEQVVAWKNGWFEFDNVDLRTIMRQISRWYDVDVSYEGRITTETFGGRTTKNLPLSEVLELLESDGLRFRLEGKKLIVEQ